MDAVVNFDDEDKDWDMSVLLPKQTGLDRVVRITCQQVNQPIPIVLVSREKGDDISCPSGVVGISISDDPRLMGDSGLLGNQDLANALKFVNLNKDVLLAHWNREIDSVEALEQLKGIEVP